MFLKSLRFHFIRLWSLFVWVELLCLASLLPYLGKCSFYRVSGHDLSFLWHLQKRNYHHIEVYLHPGWLSSDYWGGGGGDGHKTKPNPKTKTNTIPTPKPKIPATKRRLSYSTVIVKAKLQEEQQFLIDGVLWEQLALWVCEGIDQRGSERSRDTVSG